MKLRTGFVSNSSSSSFIINKDKLSEEQIEKIKNHIEIGLTITSEIPDFFGCLISEYDQWDIRETNDLISGYTFMDNFNMCRFLEKIVGINEQDIEWR